MESALTIIPSMRSVSASAAADLPLAVGPAISTASGDFMIKLNSLALGAVLLIGATDPKPMFAASADAPPDPFIHKGACPFECCTYRDWTASKTITLVNAPRLQKTVATIKSGGVVRGVTGDVFVKPV